MNNVLSIIFEQVKNNAISWIITGVVTYFTVRIATKHYYSMTKRRIVNGILELGLRSLMNLSNEKDLPDNAQAVFVEYKGRCWHTNDKEECKFGERIRKTVAVVGGNQSEVSRYKPLHYGVLGVANRFQMPVYYDFTEKKLYKYSRGTIQKIDVMTLENECFCRIENDIVSLGKTKSQRDVMIAVPIQSNHKTVGGITFDLKASYNNVFKKYESTDSEKIKRRKDRTNAKFVKTGLRTAKLIANTYFKKKGDELE